jgi:hypothetical protein
MFSARSLEGYLEIDHRESPGFTAEEAVQAGLRRIATDVGKGAVAKVPVANCSQCQRHIILNPMRTRDRFFCRKCMAYHCDRCALITHISGVCKTWKQIEQEWAAKVGA